MKRIHRVILSLGVALVLLAGLLLPRLWSLYTDRVPEQSEVQIQEVYLTFSNNYVKTLSLFGTPHTTAEYSGNTNLWKERVLQITLQFAKSVSKLWDGYESHTSFDQVYPVMISTQESPARSGIFWCVEWKQDAEPPAKIWIDDRSEKIVALEAIPLHLNNDTTVSEVLDGWLMCFGDPLYFPFYFSSADTTYHNTPAKEATVSMGNGGTEPTEEAYSFLVYLKDGLIYANI